MYQNYKVVYFFCCSFVKKIYTLLFYFVYFFFFSNHVMGSLAPGALEAVVSINWDGDIKLNCYRGELLNFHFGIGVRPKRPNRGACEWTIGEFGLLVNWIS